MSPSGNVVMNIASVQQQKSTNDCGLFAIAHAVLLSDDGNQRSVYFE